MPARAFSVIAPDQPCLSRSGLRYRTRPVRRSDEAGLRDMFLRCSSEDLRLRCFGISKTFPEVFATRLARLGALAGPTEFAIVAVLDDGQIGGVVHAAAVSGDEADYDIMVRTNLKGQGLGTRLMRDMLTSAGRAGFRAIHGDVLLGNRAMLLLAGDLGFRRIALADGVVRLEAVPIRRGTRSPDPRATPPVSPAAAGSVWRGACRRPADPCDKKAERSR